MDAQLAIAVVVYLAAIAALFFIAFKIDLGC